MVKFIVKHEWNDEFVATADTLEDVGIILEEQIEQTGDTLDDFQVFEIAREIELVRNVVYTEKVAETPMRTLGEILADAMSEKGERNIWVPRD